MQKLTDKIAFGKHKNETIQDIIEAEPQYIEWCLDEVIGFELDDDAMERYEQAIDDYYTKQLKML